MTAAIRSTGTGRDGIYELDIANAYWIPSSPNFADIDAAIVVDSTLHSIQHTIEAPHTFKTESFWDNFARPSRFIFCARRSQFYNECSKDLQLLSQSTKKCLRGSAIYPDVVDRGMRGQERYRLHWRD